jgi:hypothetical protein
MYMPGETMTDDVLRTRMEAEVEEDVAAAVERIIEERDHLRELFRVRVPEVNMEAEDGFKRLRSIRGGRYDSTTIFWNQADYILSKFEEKCSDADVSRPSDPGHAAPAPGQVAGPPDPRPLQGSPDDPPAGSVVQG